MITPLFDNVVIKPLKPEEKTEGGIILPENTTEKLQTGLIVAVGKGTTKSVSGIKVPAQVTIGQKVKYKEWTGQEIKDEGEEYIIIKQTDILAVVS